MGIIKAVKQAIGGGFADTWQEVIEPDNIGDQTVYARGVLVNSRIKKALTILFQTALSFMYMTISL